LTFASELEKNLSVVQQRRKKQMKIGDTAPDFEAETTEGPIVAIVSGGNIDLNKFCELTAN